jgi:ABC-type microcin C transport system permease subunit YejE
MMKFIICIICFFNVVRESLNVTNVSGHHHIIIPVKNMWFLPLRKDYIKAKKYDKYKKIDIKRIRQALW